MSSETELRGRQAALALVAKLSSKKETPASQSISVENLDVNLAGVEAALKTLTAKSSVDVAPLVGAIERAAQSAQSDFAGLAAAVAKQKFDVRELSEKMSGIRDALKENNKILSRLVETASKPKKIKYDNLGRVIEVHTEGG